MCPSFWTREDDTLFVHLSVRVLGTDKVISSLHVLRLVRVLSSLGPSSCLESIEECKLQKWHCLLEGDGRELDGEELSVEGKGAENITYITFSTHVWHSTRETGECG
jgi:hypothetical protein